jgi:hypothetical protein
MEWRKCILAAVMPVSARKIMRAVKCGAGVFCLGVFLLVQTMAAVPAFHSWFHHDAADPNHECAVTLLLNGQLHSPDIDVQAGPCPPLLVSHAPARCVDFVATDVRLLPSRGPPA